MTQETKKDKEIKDEDTEEVLPHIPAPKVSRFGNQQSKFGKGTMSFNPPNKQRPGRAAARGR